LNLDVRKTMQKGKDDIEGEEVVKKR